jgi:regulator of protease activity HflC (stomatin/prohibitin superfamily)
MGGLSGLMGLLSLAGLLAFLGGIGLIVVAASQGRQVRSGVSLAVAGLVIFVLFSIISSGIVIVQPQERAVVFNVLSGELQDPPLAAGTHIVIPILYEFTVYPVRQQEYTMADEDEGPQVGQDAVVARTRDGQEVRLDITVLYNLDPARLNEVHQRWQNTYEVQFVRPTVRNIVRTVVSEYEAEGIYGTNRANMETDVENRIRTAFDREGILLTGMLVRGINFRPEFAEAIERKEIEAQELARARTEAQRVETQARGQANASIERARGEAEAVILRAQAQAEALRLVSQQIAANPSLIQYEYVQRLSDNIRLALVPSTSPFLFDFASLAEADPDFLAPAVPDITLPQVELPPIDSDDTAGGGG